MAENLPNLKMEIDTQIQEAQRDRNKTNPIRPTLRHIITKMARKKKKENFKGKMKETKIHIKRKPNKPVICFVGRLLVDQK